jgi:hypothetical protein
MAQFAAEMTGSSAPYTVLRKDSAAHIVHLTAEDTHGYVGFEALATVAHGPVTETSGPALVFTKRVGDYLRISYANPELDLEFRVEDPTGLVMTELRLDGDWSIDSGDPRAELIPQGNGTTLLRFTTRHGLPVELGLIQNTSFASWQGQHFSPAELLDPTISGPAADPEGDWIPNAIEYGLLLDPRTPDLSNERFRVVLAGDAMAATFEVDRSRPDVTLFIEESTDLSSWSLLPATLTEEAFGIEQWEALTTPGPPSHFLRLGVTITEP